VLTENSDPNDPSDPIILDHPSRKKARRNFSRAFYNCCKF
jgi:hypothetical protein